MNTAQNISASFSRPKTKVQLSLEEQQAFLDIQHSILEMVAANLAQADILTELCLMAEALVPESIATVMLMQDQHSLNILSAPTVAPDDQLLLNGLKPGPTAGTCGNAVYRNEAVYTSNVHEDSRCLDICNVFDQFELNSCWSNPVRDATGNSIGSFALSSGENREPSAFHKELLAVGGHIIGILLQRSREQEQLEKMAYEDSLTGLGNRSALFRKLAVLIDKAEKDDDEFGLVYIDLDRFKILNDIFGHSVGDEILKLIGHRIRESTQEAFCAARVGGDEFVIVAHSVDQAELLGRAVMQVLSLPIEYQSYRFPMDCSVGIACFPRDGRDAESLLNNADTAMYRAKRDELRLCYYKPEFTSKSIEDFRIENVLRSAIEKNQLSLRYQGKVDARTHRTLGYETLLRLEAGENNFISPADFIPVAEKTGMIIPIGEWVVRNAMKEAQALLERGKHDFTLAINISGAQLASSEHIETILSLIDVSAFPSSSVYFEITESVLVEEASYASDSLRMIRAAGIRLAIDDFGIGYSSLGYLKRFRVSQLKMDKMLIDDICTTDGSAANEDSAAIAKAVIALGHSLGLEVVAEGVESVDQAAILAELDCDTIQGFLFSLPCRIEELLSAA
ncbi:MAG: putative bifunctional diguanylate cyclase/phosphodiesterase [Congregibacter sp.]